MRANPGKNPRGDALLQRLLPVLPVTGADVFNPWTTAALDDASFNGPRQRRARLAQHLSAPRPRILLVGEAPGHLGARASGVAFCSEKLILAGAIPRVEALAGRFTTRDLALSEPSATIIWKTLYALEVAGTTICWNAFPVHPHRPCEPLTNRTPRDDELRLGSAALSVILDAFPSATVVAVGRKAELALGRLGAKMGAAVRHPANGGARAFAEGLRAVCRNL